MSGIERQFEKVGNQESSDYEHDLEDAIDKNIQEWEIKIAHTSTVPSRSQAPRQINLIQPLRERQRGNIAQDRLNQRNRRRLAMLNQRNIHQKHRRM